MGIQFQIETTSVCQAACEFCVYPREENSRLKGNMPVMLYQKIIDDAATIDQIERLCLTGLGEPTLDPHLEFRVRYGRQNMPAKVVVDFYTNGEFLTPERFEALKEAGLGCVSVSLNAVTPEQHEKIMKLRPGVFWKVCNNLDYAIEHSDGVDVQVKAVFSREHFTMEDIHAFYARWGWKERGGRGQAVMQGNWGGDTETLFPFDPKSPCDRAITQIYVDWRGRVLTCCFDPLGHQVFGDLTRQSLREVYNGTKYLSFREAHVEGRADEYAVCKGCSRI